MWHTRHARPGLSVPHWNSQFAIRELRIIPYICQMRKHTGMRPQDIVILAKILSFQNHHWMAKDLASSLYLSPSEVSESLHRSVYAGLINSEKKQVLRLNFLEFLIHGMRYVFPQQPGSLVRGLPTAHSHPKLQKKFIADNKLVWPDHESNTIGLSIEPFYSNQILAAKQDESFYYILCLIDILRLGKPREVNFAKEELKKYFHEK